MRKKAILAWSAWVWGWEWRSILVVMKWQAAKMTSCVSEIGKKQKFKTKVSQYKGSYQITMELCRKNLLHKRPYRDGTKYAHIHVLCYLVTRQSTALLWLAWGAEQRFVDSF